MVEDDVFDVLAGSDEAGDVEDEQHHGRLLLYELVEMPA